MQETIFDDLCTDWKLSTRRVHRCHSFVTADISFIQYRTFLVHIFSRPQPNSVKSPNRPPWFWHWKNNHVSRIRQVRRDRINVAKVLRYCEDICGCTPWLNLFSIIAKALRYGRIVNFFLELFKNFFQVFLSPIDALTYFQSIPHGFGGIPYIFFKIWLIFDFPKCVPPPKSGPVPPVPPVPPPLS